MKTRSLRPELMDDPQLDRRLHFQALEGLKRINFWTGNAKLAWRPIRDLARRLRRDQVSVLDIGTGAGDVPIHLSRYAERAGIRLEITASDVSEKAIEFAKANIQRANSPVDVFRLDVLTDQIPGRYDVVMCSTFLHHFTETEAVDILQKMRAAAKRRVVVIDLVRSTFNWWQVWVATRMLSRSKVVHFDGPQSIRAAFTLPEVRDMAERAGLVHIQLRRSWPCRFVLGGEVDP